MNKKLNSYELVIILSASLEDEALDMIQKKYEDYFKANGIEVTDVEKLGRKRMAYQIKKIRTGYYLIFRFTSLGDFISKLERTLELDEQILRYLTVKMTSRALEYLKISQTKQSAASLEVDDFTEEIFGDSVPEVSIKI